jgi:hypothetical protein
MPQLIVNMEVNTQNKVRSKLKSYRFKKRHAPYLNRYAPVGETNSYKNGKIFFLKCLLSGMGKYVFV